MDAILGMKGVYIPSEDTYRTAFPRADLNVTVGRETLVPFAGLTSWAAVTSDPHHGGALLLAEFALFEDEVNPVISVALENALELTALQNHFLFERPRILFMNVSGIGAPLELATKVRRVLDEIKAIRAANPGPVSQAQSHAAPAKSEIDAAALDSILETRGETYKGMYRASMGMAGLVHGIPAGKQMGTSTWMAFWGSDAKAIVNGQIVMTTGQVQRVLRALRRAGIDITALHRSMIDEHPEFFFVSFWGEGRAADLARGLRLALETQLR